MVNTVSVGDNAPLKPKRLTKKVVIAISVILILILVGVALLVLKNQAKQPITKTTSSSTASSQSSGSIASGNPDASELRSKTTLDEDLKSEPTPAEQAAIYIKHGNDALNIDGDNAAALSYAQKAEQLDPTPASAYFLGMVNWTMYEASNPKSDTLRLAAISAFQVYLTRGTDATYAAAHPGELLHIQQIVEGLQK